VFWDSVMGCDAESLGDPFTLLPKRWESPTFQNGVQMLGNVTQGFGPGQEIATGFWLESVNEEQLGCSRIIL
jgi:hypothetical protein